MSTWSNNGLFGASNIGDVVNQNFNYPIPSYSKAIPTNTMNTMNTTPIGLVGADKAMGINIPSPFHSSNNSPTPPNGTGLAGYISAGAGVLEGLGGLANAYIGLKGLELANDQFDFQTALANRNTANQAKIVNNTYDNAAQVAAGMIGGKDSQGRYGYTDPAIVAKYAAKAKSKHVDGSPIA